MITISPLSDLYLPLGSTLAEANVLTQLSRLSISIMLKLDNRRQLESPSSKPHTLQIESAGLGKTPISPSPSVNEMMMESLVPAATEDEDTDLNSIRGSIG